MAFKAALLKTDGSVQFISPAGKKFTLDELYDLLGCDMVEVIDINRDDLLMIGNDEARFVNEPMVNQKATALYRAAWEITDPINDWKAHLEQLNAIGAIVVTCDEDEPYTIVGDVIICLENLF